MLMRSGHHSERRKSLRPGTALSTLSRCRSASRRANLRRRANEWASQPRRSWLLREMNGQLATSRMNGQVSLGAALAT